MNDSNDLGFVPGFVEDGDEYGKGDTFDLACEDAWGKLKPRHSPGTWFKVKHHWVKMINPISEHIVIMGPGGGS